MRFNSDRVCVNGGRDECSVLVSVPGVTFPGYRRGHFRCDIKALKAKSENRIEDFG